jgi:hypothetical protein
MLSSSNDVLCKGSRSIYSNREADLDRRPERLFQSRLRLAGNSYCQPHASHSELSAGSEKAEKAMRMQRQMQPKVTALSRGKGEQATILHAGLIRPATRILP